MNDWQIGMQIIQPPAPVAPGLFRAPRPKPIPKSDEDAVRELDTMLRLIGEGWKLRDIGDEIGRSKSYVHAHLKASGQYESPRAWSRKGMIADMLRRGRWSADQMRREFNVSIKYINQVIREMPEVQMVKIGVVPHYWIEK